MNAVTKPVTMSDLFNSSWNSIKDQMPLVAGLSLVWAMGMGAMSMIPVIGWMITAPFTAGYIRSLLKIRSREVIDFKDIFWGFLEFNRFIHLVLVSFLSTVLIMLGLICLIIPGIYLSIATLLATQVMVLHGTDSVESIKRSIEIVKGRWWWFLGLAICVGILNIFGAMCFFVGIFLTMPMSQFIFISAVELISREKNMNLAPEWNSTASTTNPMTVDSTNPASIFPVNPT